MTPEQLRLVRTTVVRIEDQEERFSNQFVEALLWASPDLGRFFPTDAEALGEVRRSIVRELAFLAESAGELSVFLRKARKLGTRNHRRGMLPEHYEAIAPALMTALRDTLGAEFTADVELAWRRLYCLITETMLEAAALEHYGRIVSNGA